MPESPNTSSTGPVNVRISCNGRDLGLLPVVSVTVRLAVNRIPWAEIVLADGDMPTGKFALSEADTFAPGASVSISVGYASEQTPLFSGIVVRHGVKIGSGNDSRLVVECRDQAAKMTIGRKNANYVDQKDSEIISTLIGAHGLSADVQATSVQHPELVQFYCNDWDFMLARADVNGLLVNVAQGKVSVKPPSVSGSAVLSVGWGTDLMAFEADMDARTQLASVQAVSWDPSQQAIAQGDSASPTTLNQEGNLDGEKLAGVAGPGTFVVQTAARRQTEALTEWAKAVQVKSALARIRGRMSFVGNAAAVPDCLIAVSGVGARFNGSVYVSAVEQVVTEGQWTTEVVFGLGPQWQVERPDVMAPANGGLLPGVGGLQIGVVLKLDGDPQDEQRIQVKVPVLQAQSEGVWARVMQFYASSTFGAFFMPEVGDEVLLGYLNDDPCDPVVLGSLYSSSRKPAYTIEQENNTKAIVTRCLHKIEFNEQDKIITVITPGNNQVVLDDKDESITVLDQHNNSVKLSGAGIALTSQSDIEMTAKGEVTISATGAVSISSKADVKVSGMNVSCEAQMGFTGKGTSSAELSASGQTTVRGAMVNIN